MDFQFSAGAFIFRRQGDKLLFLILKKRNDEWDLAKGHIEKGETAEIAALREIKEETGLTVELLPFFRGQTKYFFYEKKQKVLKTVKFFLAETDNKNVVISDEHKGFEWAEYDDAVKKLKFKDLVNLMPVVREYVRRLDEMRKINEEYAKLPDKTKNWDLSTRLVPGEGRLDAEVMLLGQAPGRNEDEQLRPFIGRSGMLLSKFLKIAKIRRNELYITSTVQFFPPENRLPTYEETELCKPFLMKQIELVRPKYIVLLGNAASLSMLDMTEVTENHGKIIEKDGIKYFVTFHPAAALRFKATAVMMQKDLIDFGLMLKKSKSNNKQND